MHVEQRIKEWLEDQLKDSDVFLIDLKLVLGTKVLITVDGDDLVPIKKCVEISRLTGNYIEEQDLIEKAYTLEVGSPGADAAMKVIRQFPKHVGRTIDFLMKDGSRKKGVLKKVESGALLIDETRKEKGKKAEIFESRIEAEELAEGKIILDFKNPKGKE